MIAEQNGGLLATPGLRMKIVHEIEMDYGPHYIVRHDNEYNAGYPQLKRYAAKGVNWEGGGFAVVSAGQKGPYGEPVTYRGIVFPLWVPMGLLLLTGPILAKFYWHFDGRRNYRRRHNRCLKCGYLLFNLPEPVRCPECGTDPSVPERPGRIKAFLLRTRVGQWFQSEIKRIKGT